MWVTVAGYFACAFAEVLEGDFKVFVVVGEVFIKGVHLRAIGATIIPAAELSACFLGSAGPIAF